MKAVPYKLRTDAWWLGDDFTRRTPPLDRASGCVICDRDFNETPVVDAYGEQHSDRR